MNVPLVIILDRFAETRVVLKTRRHSCPLVFIRGFPSFNRNYAWILGVVPAPIRVHLRPSAVESAYPVFKEEFGTGSLSAFAVGIRNAVKNLENLLAVGGGTAVVKAP